MIVLHIITGLSQGGAEEVLWRLVEASSASCRHTVVSLTGEGCYGKLLRQCGATVHALEMRRGRVSWRGLRRLYEIVDKTRPDVVQTWMHHANLVGGSIARLAGVRAVAWGIHSPDLDPTRNRFRTRLLGHLSGLLSGVIPLAIVYVSKEALEAHRKLGFRSSLSLTILNGVDIERFRPDHTERSRIREEWGVGPEDFLLGYVARWDPYKDHRNLLSALSILAERAIPFRCALVGAEMDAGNAALAGEISAHGLEKRMIAAGSRSDIPAVMNALDLHVLSSAAEAFGNVTVEAMAAGTPCVTTNVGPATLIVGNTGWLVEPNAPHALAATIESAMVKIKEKGKYRLGEATRDRVKRLFSLERMVQSYLTLWNDLTTR